MTIRKVTARITEYACLASLDDVLMVGTYPENVRFGVIAQPASVDGETSALFALLDRDQVCALIAQLGLWLHTPEE
jgi:hypothetical protein